MEIDNGPGLSPRKVDYLKYIFLEGGNIRTTDIASRFKVDPSTITKTICELAEAGLLLHVPYHGVSLTMAGKQHAAFLVKRHRILSLVMVRVGLSDEQACQEVTRFESLVSKEASDVMCRAMGHPHLGICGEITHDIGCMGNLIQSKRSKKRVRE